MISRKILKCQIVGLNLAKLDWDKIGYKIGSRGSNWDRMGSNRFKWDQMGSNGYKMEPNWVQIGSKMGSK